MAVFQQPAKRFVQTSLYVHYPFCLKKCLYCDFNSVAGARAGSAEYGALVVREMELRRARLEGPVIAGTLYFGGGTPSLMAPREVERIIETAASLFGLAGDAEITLEANPGTLTPDKLAGYRSAGVNRLSLGVQSFTDEMLALLGRVHTAREAEEAFAAARAAGFANISIDLINSLPGQSPAIWRSELDRALQFAPEHISAYALTIEEGTPFQVLAQQGRLILPDEEDAAGIFQETTRRLEEAGFEQYEISSFARSGHRSRHNQVYWRRGSYLGFGAGAHSFLAESPSPTRWRNRLSPEDFRTAVLAGEIPEEEVAAVTEKDAMAEFFFLGLRMREGVELKRFRREFGRCVEEVYPGVLENLVSAQLLERRDGWVALSARGIMIANQVLLRFI